MAEGAEGYFDQVDGDLGAGWEEWIFRGEKGVWEVGGYIRAKCAIEITLDHCMETPLSKKAEVVYTMLQNRRKEDVVQPSRPGGKITDTEVEWRRSEERARSKTVGPSDGPRWRGGVRLGLEERT